MVFWFFQSVLHVFVNQVFSYLLIEHGCVCTCACVPICVHSFILLPIYAGECISDFISSIYFYIYQGTLMNFDTVYFFIIIIIFNFQRLFVDIIVLWVEYVILATMSQGCYVSWVIPR